MLIIVVAIIIAQNKVNLNSYKTQRIFFDHKKIFDQNTDTFLLCFSALCSALHFSFLMFFSACNIIKVHVELLYWN